MSVLLQIMIGVPVGALEMLAILWAAQRWFGVKLPKVIVLNVDRQAEERGWTRGYVEGVQSERERVA